LDEKAISQKYVIAKIDRFEVGITEGNVAGLNTSLEISVHVYCVCNPVDNDVDGWKNREVGDLAAEKFE